MGTQYQLPPMMSGTTTQNVNELRNFLVRLVNELNKVETASTATSGTYKTVNGKQVFVPSSTSGSGSTADTETVRKSAAELRALITKTAQDLGQSIVSGDNNVISYTNTQVNGLNAELEEKYVAQSEYGSFVQEIDNKIKYTAKDVIEDYGYSELIQSAQNTANEAEQLIQNYSTTINSQIRRGLVLDPDTNEYVTGIAIAQNLQFTGNVQTGTDGQKYYEMTTGQTFGLYSSTGWQFWIDGHKKGWYNSVDGMLHISNVLIENTLQFGSNVQMIVDSTGKFGMRMITRSTT